MKISKLVGNFLTVSLFFNIICNEQVNANSQKDWAENALGIYQSQIFNGDGLVSGTTEFTKASDGSLEGNYTIKEQEGETFGTLSQCKTKQFYVISCIWNDKYGTGIFKATFSEDFSSFNGYWGEDNSEAVYEWSGSR